jgi:nucleoside 2-deoxyribosyltransferase
MREKVYLAGRFSRRHEFRSLAETLAEAGHEVTSRWLYDDEHHAELGRETLPAVAAAVRDLDDVRAASVCIAFTEEAGGPQGRGGRHVELGAAIALGLRVIVVGTPEHIFHLLPAVEQVDSVEDVLAALGNVTAVAA